MSRNTLNFDEVETNKNKFHGSKQPFVLDSMDINKTVTSGNLNTVGKALNLSLVMQTMMLLNLCVSCCLK